MKVNEDYTDKYGRTGLVFSGVKSIDEVYYFLQTHYQGYKFGIVFDCTRDEYAESDRKFYVYFLDELEDEVMDYCDYSRVDKFTYRKRGRRA